MKKVPSILIITVFMVLSCQTKSDPLLQNEPAQVTAPVPETRPIAPPPGTQHPAAASNFFDMNDADFDPANIPEAVFNTTKLDVQQFIVNLNDIIRARDFQTWTTHLGRAYLNMIKTRGFLSRMSSSIRLTSQNIVLNSVEDYFTYVVVPSRANDRVDDIEFVSPRRIKVYTINEKGQRLRLYDLERIGDMWKIVN
ncbi:lipoprotein [Spirochaetia bacterium]|nr:lipoprotein [Spirochaetia bacterium]